MKLRSYFALFCLLVFATGITFTTSCVQKKSAEKKESAEGESEVEGSAASQGLAKAPTFRAKNLLDDKEISLEDMKGYVLIIDFWATWCPPCRMEIPGFVELYEKYKDKKFAVVGISVDRGGETVVKRFMEQYRVNYPMIIATRQILSDYEKAMGKPIRAIPTTLVVNREGGITSVHLGYKSKDVFEQEIQKLL